MTVNIVVPIYKTQLSDDDKLSLDRLVGVLGDFETTVVHPEGLDLAQVKERYPKFEYKAFDPRFFAGKLGYNDFMLSVEFYEAFLDWDYILIYQTDAFVFRNELQAWCDKGYDYIGAPWLFKDWHRTYVYLELSGIKSAYLKWRKGITERKIARGKVGNGGFSLRRPRTHYDFLLAHAELAEFYKSKATHPRYYEDVFWAVEPVRQGADFKIPKSAEAIYFSFDQYPDLGYQVTDHVLPFGCHGFNKRKAKSFWKPLIADALAGKIDVAAPERVEVEPQKEVSEG